MRLLKSLRSRLLVGALIWVACASIAGGWALSYAFRSAAEDAFDARLTSLVSVLIGSVDADRNGQLTLARGIGDPQFEQVYSGWYWLVADRAGVRLRSRSLWDLRLEVPDTPVTATPRVMTTHDPLGREIRVAVQTVLLPNAASPVTFLVSGDGETLRSEIRRFNVVLRSALAALALGLLLALLAQIRFGLRPLERLVHEVEAVRTGKSSQLSPLETTELDALVTEVNSLIAHNREVVERARASASDLAHALKTPLAVIKSLETDGEAARERRQQIAAMERIVTRHLARASAAGAGRHRALALSPIVDEIAHGLQRVYAERDLLIRNELAADLAYPADQEDLEEMLGNLLENACKWATHAVRVRSRRDAGQLCIIVEDDGPGIPDEHAHQAIARGVRLDEKTSGTGLGLAIVTDLATLYGGELALARSELGGVKAELKLPT